MDSVAGTSRPPEHCLWFYTFEVLASDSKPMVQGFCNPMPFFNLNFISQVQFTFSIILYQFQVYSIVVSPILYKIFPRYFLYPPGTIHSYYNIIGYISYAELYICDCFVPNCTSPFSSSPPNLLPLAINFSAIFSPWPREMGGIVE